MHTFIVVGGEKSQQEKEIEKLISPLSIDPVDITSVIPENSIGIEEIRLLKEKIALKPYKS
jgi:hypothetical protein